MSWNVKPLGELAETQLGKMLNSSKQTGRHSRLYLRNVNVQWGWFDMSDVKSMDIFPDEESKFLARKGDLLICEGGEVGRCAVWTEDEPVGIQNAVHRVRVSSDLDTTYLRHYLQHLALAGGLEPYSSGVTIKHLTQEKLRRIPISYPPLDEQKRIGAQLEDQLGKLEAVREALRKAELGLDEMLGSVLHDFVGGGVDSSEPGTLPFSDCFHLVSNPHAGYQQKDYKQSGAVPVVDQGRDLVGGFVDETERVIRALRPVIVFGDHTRVLKFVDFDFAAGADGTKLLQTNQDLVSDRFGFFMLRATRIRNRGYARHFGELRKLNFKVPSFEDQNRIVALVDGFLQSRDSVIGQLGASADLLDSARSSILHRAFLAPEEAL